MYLSKVYEPTRLQHSFRYCLFEKEQIAWGNGTETVYDIYSCRNLRFIQT